MSNFWRAVGNSLFPSVGDWEENSFLPDSGIFEDADELLDWDNYIEDIKEDVDLSIVEEDKPEDVIDELFLDELLQNQIP